MNAPAVAVRDLSFSYPASAAPALNSISIEIAAGAWISLMGPTGAGKSTLSLCMNGLIPALQPGTWQGSVAVCGDLTTETPVPQLSARVGVLFQDFETQLFSSQVKREIAFPMENRCMEKDRMRAQVEDMLRRFDLREFAERHPAELSGGERQRLAIASVLALSPQVLVLDEPTTDLDPLNREKLLTIVREMHKDGLTIIWIDHETELALESDRLLVMDQGAISRDTTFREFFAGAEHGGGFGIRQPDIPQLFRDTPGAEVPMTLPEAVEAAKRRGLRLSRQKQQEYIAARSPGRPGKPVIQAEHLEYVYPNGTRALRGVSLEVREGEFVALLGQNGSGKTTLARHLNGLLKPSGGRVLVRGMDTRSRSIHELSQQVGYCFQNPDNQIFASTVLDEVSFGPRNHGVPSSLIGRRVAEALESVGLSGYEGRDPFVLTKGERQRIAVASILSMKPGIMVFDEPTTGLDYPQTIGMMELISRLNREGCTVIIITHAMWVAARYARRCVVMAQGKVLLEGETREVFEREDTLREASLLPPDITRLGNALGAATLSVEEFNYCMD